MIGFRGQRKWDKLSVLCGWGLVFLGLHRCVWERSSVMEHLWPCIWGSCAISVLARFRKCSLPPHGAWSGIPATGLLVRHRPTQNPARNCLSSEHYCLPLPKRSLRPWKLLVSDAVVSLSEIIVGMCFGFGLPRGSGGNETCQRKRTQQPDRLI